LLNVDENCHKHGRTTSPHGISSSKILEGHRCSLVDVQKDNLHALRLCQQFRSLKSQTLPQQLLHLPQSSLYYCDSTIYQLGFLVHNTTDFFSKPPLKIYLHVFPRAFCACSGIVIEDQSSLPGLYIPAMTCREIGFLDLGPLFSYQRITEYESSAKNRIEVVNDLTTRARSIQLLC